MSRQIRKDIKPRGSCQTLKGEDGDHIVQLVFRRTLARSMAFRKLRPPSLSAESCDSAASRSGVLIASAMMVPPWPSGPDRP